MPAHPRTVVLCLGNDILGDDGVGIEAARLLRDRCASDVDIVESSEAGLALLELLEGYDRALILDAMNTGIHAPGSIVAFSPSDFRSVTAPSPHYVGLSEVLGIAEQLDMRFPKDIRILAMEVEDPYTLREGLTDTAKSSLPGFVERAVEAMELSKSCVI